MLKLKTCLRRQKALTIEALQLEPAPGTPMVETTPAPGFVSADTAVASFPVTAAHFETDLVFREGTPNESFDIYYYNYGEEAGPLDMPFTVETIQPGANLNLSAELHGQTYKQLRYIRISLVNSRGEKVLNSLFLVKNKDRSIFQAPIAASDLVTGQNQFRMSRADTQPTSLHVLLNYVDVSYPALYRERGNSLQFNSAALAGDTSLTVTGITSTSGLELFDITPHFS